MPHAKKCPHCGRKVWDWYMEWYPQPEKGEIFLGRAAMDCPWCRNPVIFDYKTEALSKAPPDYPRNRVFQRQEGLALVTAMARAYKTLGDFLTSPTERWTATPFRFRYWPHIDLPIKRRTP